MPSLPEGQTMSDCSLHPGPRTEAEFQAEFLVKETRSSYRCSQVPGLLGRGKHLSFKGDAWMLGDHLEGML